MSDYSDPNSRRPIGTHENSVFRQTLMNDMDLDNPVVRFLQKEQGLNTQPSPEWQGILFPEEQTDENYRNSILESDSLIISDAERLKMEEEKYLEEIARASLQNNNRMAGRHHRSYGPSYYGTMDAERQKSYALNMMEYGVLLNKYGVAMANYMENPTEELRNVVQDLKTKMKPYEEKRENLPPGFWGRLQQVGGDLSMQAGLQAPSLQTGIIAGAAVGFTLAKLVSLGLIYSNPLTGAIFTIGAALVTPALLTTVATRAGQSAQMNKVITGLNFADYMETEFPEGFSVEDNPEAWNYAKKWSRIGAGFESAIEVIGLGWTTKYALKPFEKNAWYKVLFGAEMDTVSWMAGKPGRSMFSSFMRRFFVSGAAESAEENVQNFGEYVFKSYMGRIFENNLSDDEIRRILEGRGERDVSPERITQVRYEILKETSVPKGRELAREMTYTTLISTLSAGGYNLPGIAADLYNINVDVKNEVNKVIWDKAQEAYKYESLEQFAMEVFTDPRVKNMGSVAAKQAREFYQNNSEAIERMSLRNNYLETTPEIKAELDRLDQRRMDIYWELNKENQKTYKTKEAQIKQKNRIFLLKNELRVVNETYAFTNDLIENEVDQIYSSRGGESYAGVSSEEVYAEKVAQSVFGKTPDELEEEWRTEELARVERENKRKEEWLQEQEAKQREGKPFEKPTGVNLQKPLTYKGWLRKKYGTDYGKIKEYIDARHETLNRKLSNNKVMIDRIRRAQKMYSKDSPLYKNMDSFIKELERAQKEAEKRNQDYILPKDIVEYHKKKEQQIEKRIRKLQAQLTELSTGKKRVEKEKVPGKIKKKKVFTKETEKKILQEIAKERAALQLIQNRRDDYGHFVYQFTKDAERSEFFFRNYDNLMRRYNIHYLWAVQEEYIGTGQKFKSLYDTFVRMHGEGLATNKAFVREALARHMAENYSLLESDEIMDNLQVADNIRSQKVLSKEDIQALETEKATLEKELQDTDLHLTETEKEIRDLQQKEEQAATEEFFQDEVPEERRSYKKIKADIAYYAQLRADIMSKRVEIQNKIKSLLPKEEQPVSEIQEKADNAKARMDAVYKKYTDFQSLQKKRDNLQIQIKEARDEINRDRRFTELREERDRLRDELGDVRPEIDELRTILKHKKWNILENQKDIAERYRELKKRHADIRLEINDVLYEMPDSPARNKKIEQLVAEQKSVRYEQNKLAEQIPDIEITERLADLETIEENAKARILEISQELEQKGHPVDKRVQSLQKYVRQTEAKIKQILTPLGVDKESEAVQKFREEYEAEKYTYDNLLEEITKREESNLVKEQADKIESSEAMKPVEEEVKSSASYYQAEIDNLVKQMKKIEAKAKSLQKGQYRNKDDMDKATAKVAVLRNIYKNLLAKKQELEAQVQDAQLDIFAVEPKTKPVSLLEEPSPDVSLKVQILRLKRQIGKNGDYSEERIQELTDKIQSYRDELIETGKKYYEKRTRQEELASEKIEQQIAKSKLEIEAYEQYAEKAEQEYLDSKKGSKKKLAAELRMAEYKNNAVKERSHLRQLEYYLADMLLNEKQKTPIRVPSYYKSGKESGKTKTALYKRSDIPEGVDTTIDMIRGGYRTATTRLSQYVSDIKKGQLITFYDERNKQGVDEITVLVTSDPYKVSDITPEEWSEREGWDKKHYDFYAKQNFYQYTYEIYEPEAKVAQKTEDFTEDLQKLEAQKKEYAEKIKDLQQKITEHEAQLANRDEEAIRNVSAIQALKPNTKKFIDTFVEFLDTYDPKKQIDERFERMFQHISAQQANRKMEEHYLILDLAKAKKAVQNTFERYVDELRRHIHKAVPKNMDSDYAEIVEILQSMVEPGNMSKLNLAKLQKALATDKLEEVDHKLIERIVFSEPISFFTETQNPEEVSIHMDNMPEARGFVDVENQEYYTDERPFDIEGATPLNLEKLEQIAETIDLLVHKGKQLYNNKISARNSEISDYVRLAQENLQVEKGQEASKLREQVSTFRGNMWTPELLIDAIDGKANFRGPFHQLFVREYLENRMREQEKIIDRYNKYNDVIEKYRIDPYSLQDEMEIGENKFTKQEAMMLYLVMERERPPEYKKETILQDQDKLEEADVRERARYKIRKMREEKAQELETGTKYKRWENAKELLFHANGIDDYTAEVFIKQLRKESPALIKLADFVYDDLNERLAEMNRKMHEYDNVRISDRFTILPVMLKEADNEALDIDTFAQAFFGQVKRSSRTAGILRTEGTGTGQNIAKGKQAYRMDIVGMWMDVMPRQEHYINHTNTILKWRNLLKEKDFKNTVIAKFGDSYYRALENYVTFASTPDFITDADDMSKLWSKLGRNVATTHLALNVAIALKQTISGLWYMKYAGVGQYYKSFFKAISYLAKKEKFVEYVGAKNPLFFKRHTEHYYRSISRDWMNGKFENTASAITKLSTKLVTVLDRITVAIGEDAVYEAAKKRGADNPVLEAQLVTERTQPGGSKALLPEQYRKTDSSAQFVKMAVLMFTQQAVKNYNMSIGGTITEMKNGEVLDAIKTQLVITLSGVLLSAMSGGLEDWLEEPEQFFYEMARYRMSLVPYVGRTMAALMGGHSFVSIPLFDAGRDLYNIKDLDEDALKSAWRAMSYLTGFGFYTGINKMINAATNWDARYLLYNPEK